MKIDTIHTYYPFQDPKLDLEARIDDLIKRLTLQEKLGFIPTKQHAVKRLGIGPYHVGGEAAHGLVLRDGKPTTIFPQTIGLGCTWNSHLLKLVGTVIGDEARAYYHANGQRAGLTLWAPTVDLERDPRWGRTEEAYGEDPYLTSALASAFVQGMQGEHPFYLKTAAALKHFFANNNEENRCWCSANIDPRNMQEYYWQAYKPVVENAAVCCLMTAYNEINGIPAILNKDVKNVVKRQWGLPGFVVGDGEDFSQTVSLHKYYDNHAESIADTIKSGVDCLPDDPELIIKSLNQALERGLLIEADIDQALKNIFRVRIRLGQLDYRQENPYASTSPEVICNPKHSRIALQAQRESIVLLKNAHQYLPLNKHKIKKLAVIGPLADVVYTDWYSGFAPYTKTILEEITARMPTNSVKYTNSFDQVALKARAFNRYIAPSKNGTLCACTDQIDKATYELADWGWGRYTLKSLANNKFVTTGKTLTASAREVYGWFVRELYDIAAYKSGNQSGHHFLKTWDYKNVGIDQLGQLAPKSGEAVTEKDLIEIEVVKDGINTAVKAAQEADVVVVCVGNHPLINGKEEIDRPDITLPSSQRKLVKAVYQANPNTVLVVVAGYPVAINWEQEHLPAILYTANCGQELGRGVAEVLFGDYNPGGRLNMTWYRSKSQIPDIMDYDIIKGKRTYQYFDQKPLYPFGHGLSYTDFAYGDLKIKHQQITNDGQIELEFKVTNTGKLPGDEVVQIYIKYPDSRIKLPQKQLRRFKRISLQPGQMQICRFSIPASELEYFNPRLDARDIAPGIYTVLAGASSTDIRLAATVIIQAEKPQPRYLDNMTKAVNYDDYENIYFDRSKNGDTAVCSHQGRGWIAFYDVKPPKGKYCMQAQISNPAGTGSLEVYIDNINGSLIGSSGRISSENKWSTIAVKLDNFEGTRDLYIYLKNDLRLTWIRFIAVDDQDN